MKSLLERRSSFVKVPACTAFSVTFSLHYNFGVALKHQGDWQGAAREFAKAAELRPGHPQAHCSLAEALAHTGDRDGSAVASKRALEVGHCQSAQPQ